MAGKIYLIDGYNVIKKQTSVFFRMPTLEQQREHLLKLIRSSHLLREAAVIVVFDGSIDPHSQPGRNYPGIRVVFSSGQKEADDVIKDIVRHDSGQRTIIVVSSDQSIQHTARDHGASMMTARDFWKKIQPEEPSKKQTDIPDRELSDREVKEWLKMFGINSSENLDD
ncbi:MAG: hypothetical protein EH225_04500 [Calditrichaeota bacterium]|nr:NYN domain-containing protein [Calditrichota bacterium]RQW05647.1 MAG: hypothetical protein EH225_04500 [Calditrichota bacterium]